MDWTRRGSLRLRTSKHASSETPRNRARCPWRRRTGAAARQPAHEGGARYGVRLPRGARPAARDATCQRRARSCPRSCAPAGSTAGATDGALRPRPSERPLEHGPVADPAGARPSQLRRKSQSSHTTVPSSRRARGGPRGTQTRRRWRSRRRAFGEEAPAFRFQRRKWRLPALRRRSRGSGGPRRAVIMSSVSTKQRPSRRATSRPTETCPLP